MTLLLLSLAWLAGIALAALAAGGWWHVVAAAGALAGTLLMLSGRGATALLAASATVACLLAVLRYDGQAGLPLAPVLEDGGPVRLRGLVLDEPAFTERSQRVLLSRLELANGPDWLPVEGKAMLLLRPFPRFSYGDSLEAEGRPETAEPAGGFDYAAYLARQGVVVVVPFPDKLHRSATGGGSDARRFLIEARDTLGESISRSLPEPEASLGRGILLGQRQEIPRSVTDDFNRAGISHLIAISGYNVMLLAGILAAALAWLVGRRPATLLAMAAVLLFALFVGGGGSVLRATAMAQVLLGARLAGRPGNATTAVVFAAAVLTAGQPSLIDDVGFQLSLAATLGIVLLARDFEERLAGLARLAPGTLPYAVAESLAVTSAASLAVLPVTLTTFGRLPLYSLGANLLALPAFPLALGGSLLTSLAGLVSSGLGETAGAVCRLPLSYLVLVARLTAGLPSASLAAGEAVAASAALLLILLFLLRRRRQPRDLQPSRPPLRPVPALALTLLLLAAFAWRDALADGPRHLRVTVLDVGQGDAILIETPSGLRILVDGGPSGPRLMQALGRAMPGSRRIDLMVLTHGQDDHVSGLVQALQRYDVRQALAGPLPGTSAAYAAWREALTNRDVPLRTARAGEWLDLGGGVLLEVLGPGPTPLHSQADDLNDNSVVLRLSLGEFSMLLTGDLAAAGESALLAGAGSLRATVLKAGHHGSDTSTTPEFLEAVSPALVAISAGEENTFGHPSPTLLLRLQGIPVLRTDLNGDIRLTTDGRRLWFETERGPARVTAAD